MKIDQLQKGTPEEKAALIKMAGRVGALERKRRAVLDLAIDEFEASDKDADGAADLLREFNGACGEFDRDMSREVQRIAEASLGEPVADILARVTRNVQGMRTNLGDNDPLEIGIDTTDPNRPRLTTADGEELDGEPLALVIGDLRKLAKAGVLPDELATLVNTLDSLTELRSMLGDDDEQPEAIGDSAIPGIGSFDDIEVVERDPSTIRDFDGKTGEGA